MPGSSPRERIVKAPQKGDRKMYSREEADDCRICYGVRIRDNMVDNWGCENPVGRSVGQLQGNSNGTKRQGGILEAQDRKERT